MIVFIDFGTLAVIVLSILSVAAGTAMTAVEWLSTHLLLVIIILTVKSALFIFIMHRFEEPGDIAAVPLDILRSGAVLWMLSDALFTAFSTGGGLFHAVETLLGLVIVGPLVVLASIAPLRMMEDSPIRAELISLAGLGLCALIIYGVFSGW